MKINIITVGQRASNWIVDGYKEYERRLPRDCMLHLVEIMPSKRSPATQLSRALHDEGERMLAAIPKGDRIWALDQVGKSFDTLEMSKHLADWRAGGRDVSLLIGGADGLASVCFDRAEVKWSLSPLTMPHMLVRIIVAEQIYRAWTILNNHPYHRV